MRRKDREITDNAKINEIIGRCHCCRLGFYDEGEIYIVPLNFGYAEQEGQKIFYFHGAKAGRKVELAAKSPMVGFEMDTNYQLIENENPCEYSARFQSIIGTGKLVIIEDKTEKNQALQAIMRHNTKKEDWNFTESMTNAVCVFKLEVQKISCKDHP